MSWNFCTSEAKGQKRCRAIKDLKVARRVTRSRLSPIFYNFRKAVTFCLAGNNNVLSSWFNGKGVFACHLFRHYAALIWRTHHVGIVRLLPST
jgi:hypothetical protein